MRVDILQTIGSTHLVRINKLNKNKNVNIFAKIEGSNPSGSIKDRIALQMIEDAESKGILTKNKTIIEATSGNTGIALAMIAAVKGYKIKIVMSEAVSIERRKMLQAFGAELILTNPSKGTDGAIIKAKKILKNNPEKYFMPNQYINKNNPLAHYFSTAEEIISQTNGNIDFFLAAKGTTGTLMGIGLKLKEYNKNIKVIGVEPNMNHKIQGLKNMNEAVIPEIYDSSLLNKTIFVEDENAFQTTRNLARYEGIFAGMSSGAVMYAALEIAETIEKGNIIIIFPDRGEKYLSTNLF